ncbi:transcriptional regulator of sorbose uptake and utilization genes [Klebsiella pneumoniae]|nr:transcriptional regulator of sorbose uptake and utilization genes [Klebsiella pneumoniae]
MTMENSDDIRLIVKIAQLYYEQDMTQAQIARELGCCGQVFLDTPIRW